MKKPLLYLGFLALVFFSCKKETQELPPATQTGANTFGARINGELWLPSGFASFPAANMLEVRLLPGGDLFIHARNFSKSPTETEFEFRLRGITGPGTYVLSTLHTGYYVKRTVNPENEWQTNAQYTGTLTITRLDTVARIISGTFQFQAINQYNTPQPISVTDGRFDLSWQ